MIIWGKIFGGILGLVFLGPAGAVLGIVFGHIFDNGLNNVLNTSAQTAQVRIVFFRTVFQVMGCLAKADGVVSEHEIRVARNIMLNDFSLTQAQMALAIQYFNEGKQPDFNLATALNKFKYSCTRTPDLRRFFLELIVKAAIADKVLWPTILQKLKYICTHLNLPLSDLEYQLRIHNFTSYTKQGSQQRQSSGRIYSTSTSLSNAYSILGVTREDDNNTIKTAYRRLMSKYHPDKLVSKGLPEEMLDIAKEKTQSISTAYELIMRNRK